MTDLIVRKMRFAFADHDVPFLWNEANRRSPAWPTRSRSWRSRSRR